MKTLRTVTMLGALAAAGCSLLDAEQLMKQSRANALAAVTAEIAKEFPTPVSLKVERNPWGQGLFVFNTEPASPADVAIWLFFPAQGSLLGKPKGNELFVVTLEASKLTPKVPLVEHAEERVLGPSGLAHVPQKQTADLVFRAIKNGTFLAETPINAEAGRN